MRLLTSAFLLVSAYLIWLNNLSWVPNALNTLPILAALPLYFWLGKPWQWKTRPQYWSIGWLIWGSAFLVLGAALKFTFIMAAGWTLWFGAAVRRFLESKSTISTNKLLILPFLSFPWLATDAPLLGWWFRYSGAWITERLLVPFFPQIERQGTFVFVNQTLISVDAACSGLNILQAICIVGACVALIKLKNTQNWLLGSGFLIILAWTANTLRIVLLGIAALSIGPQFAQGAFHTWGALLLVCLMFSLCWTVYGLLEKAQEPSD